MRALTSLVCTAALLASGCYESREGDDLPDGGPLPVDAGPGPRDVGPPHMDTAPPPPVVCVGSGTIEITYTAIGDDAEAAGCEAGRTGEFALVYDMLPVPDGVELRLDLCPDADADCRCDVAVSGVGSDALPRSALMASVAFRFAASGVALDEQDVDPLARLFFLAVDGPLSAPPVASESVTVTAGATTCEITGSDGCEYVRRNLAFVRFVDGFPGPIGTEFTLAEGETESVEVGATLRVVRSSDVLCPGDISTAAWAFWRSID